MTEKKINQIYEITLKQYNKAFENAPKENIQERFSAISDSVPGYNEKMVDFGDYIQENYAVLFVDMRNSTRRAEKVGARITFLTMHVYLTALLEVVKMYKGQVVDIMGDGLMVFWGGKNAREEDKIPKAIAVQQAGLCGKSMLEVNEKVINKIINDKNLGAKINIGVGVTFDSVVVTKIGINNIYDVKAFGDCINKASKYSSKADNQVIVSKKVKKLWPTSQNGQISFSTVAGEDAFYLN